MNNKYQIIVKGDDGTTEKVKTTSITNEILTEIKPLLQAIIENKKTNKYNWSNDTELVKDNNSAAGWVSEPKVYKMYPRFDKKLINKVMRKYIPHGMLYRIYDITILKVDEVKIM